MAARQEQQSIDTLLECPITGTRFVDPVIAEDGHTYDTITDIYQFFTSKLYY